ncbi:helix-turn-helix domain-containing protein [Paenibacillus marinisediminis]
MSSSQQANEPTYEVSPNPSLIERKALHILFAGESQTKPNHKLGPKLYDYYLLHHILEGYGTYITEARTYELGPGDAFLIAPNQLVSYVSDSIQPWKYRWAAFKGDEAKALIRRAGFTESKPTIHAIGDATAAEGLERMRTAFQKREMACDLSACGSLYLIMAAYANYQSVSEDAEHLKPENEAQQIVRQMIRMMSIQYAHPFTMEQMAGSLGYSRAYLSRLFKQVTEMSPITFLLKLRIDKGRQLLRDRPDLSVEQIAASVGLTDPLYFSRQFRRFYEQSPTQYRSSILSYQTNRPTKK